MSKKYIFDYRGEFSITVLAESYDAAYGYLTNMGGRAEIIAIEHVGESMHPEFLELDEESTAPYHSDEPLSEEDCL